MNIGKLITKYRKEAGLTLDELAEKSGISKSTINKIISGASKAPTLESIRALAKAMGKTLNDFDDEKRASTMSAEALKFAKKYENLNTTSKGAVSALITYYEASTEVRMKRLPVFGQSFAAGFGEPDFGTDWFTAVDVPEDTVADFGCKVHGDSLEPYYHDGDIALAMKGMPQVGQVGCFYLDGEWILKQYCKDNKGNVFLFALNRDCASTDRILNAGEEHTLACMGTLVGLRPPLPEY